MSTETNAGPNLRRKLLAVMQAIGGVPKNGTAPQSQGGYAFQQAADIFPKVQRALIDVGVMFLAHEVSRRPSSSHQTKNGGVMFVDDVTMRYSFLDTDSDERLEGEGSGVAFNNSDKALNAAKTAALKYFFKQTFLIGEKGDDPESHDTGEFYDDGRDPADSFQASNDPKITEAQELSINTWCSTFGIDFRAVFGDVFNVEIPAQMTDAQYVIWVEKRDRILQERQREASAKRAGDLLKRQEPAKAPPGASYASEAQAKRFYAIAKGDKELMRQVLDQFSIVDDRQIPRALYDKVIAEVQKAVG